MSNNRADIRQKIENWFELHSDEMIEDLGRLIAVKSIKGPPDKGMPYGQASREVLTLAQTMLEDRGFTVSVFEDMIITADMGPGPPKLGILAHLDIVDPGEGWETDPYKLTIKDSRIYARGTGDDKGPAAAAMYAMYCARELCPELKNGFQLILGSGEETGCEDIAQYLSKNTPPPYVFTPDASYPIVNIEKGRATVFFGASWEKETALPRVISITGGKTLNVVPNRAEAVVEGFSINELDTYCMIASAQTGTKITVDAGEVGIIISAEGTATHAATPHLGVNAQTALLDMLSGMPFAEGKGYEYICALSRLFPHGDCYGRALGAAMSDEKTGELTLNFGVLRFTETDLAGNFDSRTPACADEIDLIGMMQAALEHEGIKLTNTVTSKCHHTPEDSPFVQTLMNIYEEYTGNTREYLSMGGQTYVHEIPGGVAFGCKLPDIDNNVHGANEFIDMEQLMVSAKMFAQAIIDLCG